MLLPTDYKQIFWSFRHQDPVTLIREVNYKFLDINKDIQPNLLVEAELSMDDESIRNQLKKWTSEDGNTLAIGLTSKNGLVLKLTIYNDLDEERSEFPNTLSIGFNQGHLEDRGNLLSYENLKSLFKFGIDLFDPHYAYMCKSGEINISEDYKARRKKYLRNKVPIVLEWFNYFNEEWVERLGGDVLLLSSPAMTCKKLKKGILLILQETPFDYHNLQHIKRRKEVETHIRLDDILASYQK